MKRAPDAARKIAFDALRQVNGGSGYANLVISQLLATHQFDTRDAGFVTELVAGTIRLQGLYDLIIEQAAGRKLTTMQPAVVDLLRLGTHQLLAMRLPKRAGVAATVNLAALTVGERVTGLVNAILRKVALKTLTEWRTELVAAHPEAALGIQTGHPQWIADAYVDLLGSTEAEQALLANNQAPVPTLVVRPGLAEVSELVGATPTQWSPFGATASGDPASFLAVQQGRAGVQDEGSQLVTWALARVSAPQGPWLDLCAGPGGKAALLAGLAAQNGAWLVANELQPHRAELVKRGLAVYNNTQTICCDGRQPAWRSGQFARVLADVPCSGLGALRRRPDSRWRRQISDLTDLKSLQIALLRSAISSAMPGGVIAYVTCSPHRFETSDVIDQVLDEADVVKLLPAAEYLSEVPNAELGNYVQLWPHRHQTDAMFLALLRKVA